MVSAKWVRLALLGLQNVAGPTYTTEVLSDEDVSFPLQPSMFGSLRPATQASRT